MEHYAMRFLAFLLGGLLLLPHLAWGQYTGNMPPGTVLGNTQSTARPAQPIPFSEVAVSGPATSTINEITSWHNVTGKLLREGPAGITDSKTGGVVADGSALIAKSNTTYTANQIYQMTTPVTVSTYDAIRGVAVATAGTTTTGVNGVAGYVVADTPNGGNTGSAASAVALFGTGIAKVDGAITWGINTLLIDNTSTAASTGTGRELWNEFDFNVTSPNTVVRGLVLTGISSAQPAVAVGLEVRPLGTNKWVTAMASQGGAATNGLVIGTRDFPGAVSSPSQLMLLNWSDGGGAIQNHYFYAEPNRLILDSTDVAGAGNLVLNKGGLRTTSGGAMSGLVIGRQAAAGASASQTMHFEWANALGVGFNNQLQVTTDGLMQLTTNGAAPSGGFSIPAGAAYYTGGVSGVSCAGAPTVGFATIGGIVTAC